MATLASLNYKYGVRTAYEIVFKNCNAFSTSNRNHPRGFYGDSYIALLHDKACYPNYMRRINNQLKSNVIRSFPNSNCLSCHLNIPLTREASPFITLDFQGNFSILIVKQCRKANRTTLYFGVLYNNPTLTLLRSDNR